MNEPIQRAPDTRPVSPPASIFAAQANPRNASTAEGTAKAHARVAPAVMAASATASPKSNPATYGKKPRSSYSPMMAPATAAVTAAAAIPSATRTSST